MQRHAAAPKPRLDHAPWKAPLHWGKLASGSAPAVARDDLLFQPVRLGEQFLDSKHIDIPSLFHQDPLRKRILFALHIDPIADHLEALIQQQDTLKLEPVFDSDRATGSTREMRTWYKTRIASRRSLRR